MPNLRSVELTRGEHLAHVYKDPDFINEIQELRKELEQAYGQGVSFQVGDDGIMFYKQVGMPYIKKQEDRKKIRDLAEAWLISLEDLVYIADGHSGRLTKKSNKTGDGKIHVKPVPMANIQQHSETFIRVINNKMVIELGPRIKMADIVRNWHRVREAQKLIYGSKTNSRKTSNYDLVYAYFKAEKSGKSPKEIYLDYIDEKLPGYNKEDGKGKKIGSLKSLTQHYNRYKPDISNR
jgi:hypothetical protein